MYYFEVAPGPEGQPGLAYHRVYGTPERPIDVLAEVRERDVVPVPHGWHVPSIAAPGHDLYSLDVTACPGAGQIRSAGRGRWFPGRPGVASVEPATPWACIRTGRGTTAR